MTGAFLIMLREGVEAALVVGIVLAVLNRMGAGGAYARHVAWGVALAVVASVAFAAVADRVADLFSGAGQEVLNGAVLFVAAATLTYVVVWVRAARGRMAAELDGRARVAAARGLGLFTLVFVTVFREGFESVLFLWGVSTAGGAGAADMVAGAVLGLVASLALAWALFAGGRRVPLKGFFDATMVLLVFLAAGMLANAAGFWVAVDWLPALAHQVWDTSRIVPERGALGSALTVLLGYNANPTLMEVSVYGGYLGLIGLWLLAGRVRRPAPARS
ncbi:MAG: FTR1 family protein [Nitrospirae bacterium]|nr:FTR1 family protein [Nitrospirota bacterium]